MFYIWGYNTKLDYLEERCFFRGDPFFCFVQIFTLKDLFDPFISILETKISVLRQITTIAISRLTTCTSLIIAPPFD